MVTEENHIQIHNLRLQWGGFLTQIQHLLMTPVASRRMGRPIPCPHRRRCCGQLRAGASDAKQSSPFGMFLKNHFQASNPWSFFSFRFEWRELGCCGSHCQLLKICSLPGFQPLTHLADLLPGGFWSGNIFRVTFLCRF